MARLSRLPAALALRLRARRAASSPAPSRGAASPASPAADASAAMRRIRNIGVSAHIDAGKTTATERMLFFAGAIARTGEVHDGDTVTDFLPQERERGITIKAAAISFGWPPQAPLPTPLQKQSPPPFTINLIDTPGHVDFTMEVERSMRVLDGCVLLYDGVSGVEAQSETVWGQARRHDVAKVAFANKMDREGASLPLVAASMRRRLGAEPLVLHLPLGEAGAFAGVADLVSMQLVAHTDALGRELWRIPLATLRASGDTVRIPARSDGEGPLELRIIPLIEAARVARELLLAQLADADDVFADAYLQALDKGGSNGDALDITRPGLSAVEVTAALRRVVCAPQSRYVPLLAGSAYKNKGVQLLLDAVCALLPSPLERPPVTAELIGAKGWSRAPTVGLGAAAAPSSLSAPQVVQASQPGLGFSQQERVIIKPDPFAPLRALAFKVQHSAQRGPLVFFRVYAGVMTRTQPLLNAATGERERPSKLLQMFADEQREVEAVACGHIGAAAGLRGVRTGDTLCVVGDPQPVLLASVSSPRPVFTAALEVGGASEQRQLEDALALLLREDPSLHVRTDADTGQTLLAGMGELHLDIAVDRLVREHGVPVRLGRVMVAYRETVAAAAEADVVYDKQAGTRRLWCRLALAIEPLAPSDLEAAAGATSSSAPCVFEQQQGPILCRLVGDGTGATLKGKGGKAGSEAAGEAGGGGDGGLRPMPASLGDALRESVAAALGRGPLLGYPLVGLRLSLIPERCEISGVDTNAAAVRACAARAVEQAVREAQSLLLEPVMAVEVSVPDASVGDVINDLSAHRRGSIREVCAGDDVFGALGGSAGVRGKTAVLAAVPLKSMVGYSTSLRSRTAGEGTFSMELQSYAHVGAALQRDIIRDPSLA